MSTTILSICIATVPDRCEEFDLLYSELNRQTEGLPVEIVVNDAPRGTMSIGAKRQAMNQDAQGAYVVHIDDDDWVPPEYVTSIVGALQSGPDCVGHYELVEGVKGVPQLSIWSNRVLSWQEGAQVRSRYGVDYARTPFHKTPLKREHALAVGFRDMGFGEDHEFSRRLQASGLCRTEVFIPKVLYFYRCDPKPKTYQ